MAWRSRVAVVVFGLGVGFLGACDGRLLPGGFPSSTDGSGGSKRAGSVVVTPPEGAGGATGGSGAGGSGVGGAGIGGSGAGGSTDDGGALTCDEAMAIYAQAVEQDRACDPNSAQPQCQLHVIPALCVSGCPATTYVNSTAASSAARLRWDSVMCPVTSCLQACAPLPTGGHCAPTSEGRGRCVDIAP